MLCPSHKTSTLQFSGRFLITKINIWVKFKLLIVLSYGSTSVKSSKSGFDKIIMSKYFFIIKILYDTLFTDQKVGFFFASWDIEWNMQYGNVLPLHSVWGYFTTKPDKIYHNFQKSMSFISSKICQHFSRIIFFVICCRFPENSLIILCHIFFKIALCIGLSCWS